MQANTARSQTPHRLTLRGVLPGTILSLQASVLACVESNFSYFQFEYLRENEFLTKTILACLSGAQMGSINEKNRGWKYRDTAPLNEIHPTYVCMVDVGFDSGTADWPANHWAILMISKTFAQTISESLQIFAIIFLHRNQRTMVPSLCDSPAAFYSMCFGHSQILGVQCLEIFVTKRRVHVTAPLSVLPRAIYTKLYRPFV